MSRASDPSSAILTTLRKLPQDESTIRVFEVDNIYRSYGKNAEYIADNVHKTRSVLKYYDKTPYCTMNSMIFGDFMKSALLSQGLKVEIYTREGGSFKLYKKASPGNLQGVEDIVGDNVDQNPVVIAVKVSSKAGEKDVGVCFIDANSRKIGLAQFSDDELLSNLESLVIQLGVKECISPTNNSGKDFDLAKIKDIMDRCNVLVTERPGSDFKEKDVEQDLERLLGDNQETEFSVSVLPELSNNTLSVSSAAALIKYLELMSNTDDYGKYELLKHDLSQYMKLDASALKALNLLPDAKLGSRTMSLSGLLNKCKTAPGTRLLEQWLKQPLVDVEKIEARHYLVEAMINDSILRQTLQEDLLKAVPDINRLVHKFQRDTAKLEDVVRIYQLIAKLPEFINSLGGVEDLGYKRAIEEAYLKELVEYAGGLEKLQEMVETTVDLEALDNHEYIIKPDFDEGLISIREEMDQLREEMNKLHMKAADDLNMDMEKKLKLEQDSKGEWCFRLTRNDAGVLKKKSGYIELSTLKAGCYFTTTKLRHASDRFGKLNKQYNQTQASLVKEVVKIAATYCPVLEKLSTVIAHLDVIVSFAHVSCFAPEPYVKPKMHPRKTGSTVLKQARHPCMEAQDEITFIPNDVKLVRGESEFLVITGPNMGGKSTYIRQIGVIALMAQAGCFVPCSEAELTIFDSILARVGAGDSQLKGVSTFMAEMLETATILKTATSESLIVIDELGRGTSTYDGFGLAWSISEHIVKHIGCFAMFATHFHELTALADNHPTVFNMHVVAHVSDEHKAREETAVPSSNDITLLYRVEPGISDQSFGINVAEVVKFPQKVVNMAKRKATELEDYAQEEGTEEIINSSHKYSKQDVQEGSELLRTILKQWAKDINLEKETPAEAASKLRSLVKSSDYNQKIQDSVFIQDVMNNLG